MKCILSGLEIPKGQMNREHYLPKSRVPYYIAQNPYNIYPAIKIINSIKGDLYPCSWESCKFNLVARAYQNYNLRHGEKALVKWVLDEMRPINPCEHCLASCYKQYCINCR